MIVVGNPDGAGKPLYQDEGRGLAGVDMLTAKQRVIEASRDVFYSVVGRDPNAYRGAAMFVVGDDFAVSDC